MQRFGGAFVVIPLASLVLAIIAGFPWSSAGWSIVGIGVLIPAYVKFDDRLTQRREWARLIADCDAQHDAWKRGDDVVAFFGHHPPTPEPGPIVASTGRPPPPPIDWDNPPRFSERPAPDRSWIEFEKVVR